VIRPDAPPARAPLFTLAAAVAIVDACREAGVNAHIKWPNDVLVGGLGDETDTDTDADSEGRGGRKVAGILTEMEGEADRVSWLILGSGSTPTSTPICSRRTRPPCRRYSASPSTGAGSPRPSSNASRRSRGPLTGWTGSCRRGASARAPSVVGFASTPRTVR